MDHVYPGIPFQVAPDVNETLDEKVYTHTVRKKTT